MMPTDIISKQIKFSKQIEITSFGAFPCNTLSSANMTIGRPTILLVKALQMNMAFPFNQHKT